MNGKGHNSMTLSAEEQRALFHHHLAAVQEAHDRTAEARAEERRRRKLAKADGIKLRNLDFALRINDTDDEDIIVDELAEMHRIAAWMGLPVGTQGDFDLDAEPIEDRAAREGDAAGRKGKDRDAPYPVASKPEQAWLKAYDKGRKAQLEELAAVLEKKAAEEEEEDEELEDA